MIGPLITTLKIPGAAEHDKAKDAVIVLDAIDDSLGEGIEGCLFHGSIMTAQPDLSRGERCQHQDQSTVSAQGVGRAQSLT